MSPENPVIVWLLNSSTGVPAAAGEEEAAGGLLLSAPRQRDTGKEVCHHSEGANPARATSGGDKMGGGSRGQSCKISFLLFLWYKSDSFLCRLFSSGMSEVGGNLSPQTAVEGDPIRAESEGWRYRCSEGSAQRSPVWAAGQPGSISGGSDMFANTLPWTGSLWKWTPEAQEWSWAPAGEGGPFGGGVSSTQGHCIQSKWTLSARERICERTLHEPNSPSR